MFTLTSPRTSTCFVEQTSVFCKNSKIKTLLELLSMADYVYFLYLNAFRHREFINCLLLRRLCYGDLIGSLFCDVVLGALSSLANRIAGALL